jgi:hypothetical protein
MTGQLQTCTKRLLIISNDFMRDRVDEQDISGNTGGTV